MTLSYVWITCTKYPSVWVSIFLEKYYLDSWKAAERLQFVCVCGGGAFFCIFFLDLFVFWMLLLSTDYTMFYFEHIISKQQELDKHNSVKEWAKFSRNRAGHDSQTAEVDTFLGGNYGQLWQSMENYGFARLTYMVFRKNYFNLSHAWKPHWAYTFSLSLGTVHD